MRTVFLAAERVVYYIKDKDTKKTERIPAARLCVAHYEDEECRDMKVIKATPAFADFASKHIGEAFDFKAIAFDDRGRACALYDA